MNEKLCGVCSAIDILNLLGDAAPYLGPSELGPYQEILKKVEYCVLCRLVIEALSVHAREHWKPGVYPVETCFLGRYGDETKRRLDVWFEATTATLLDGQAGHLAVLGQLLPLVPAQHNAIEAAEVGVGSHDHGPEYGRQLTPQFDASVVRGWIDECVGHHDERCNPPVDPELHYIGLLLIDVQRMCLVSADWATRYIALSYVWGQAKQFKTLKDNFFELREEGALREVHDELPRVIQDAVAFVAAVGERYMWVDALSIIQDDDWSKAFLLPMMGMVYGRSLFTLIAMSGVDADAPLPGLREGTRTEAASPIEVGGVKLVARGADLATAQRSTIWNTRAWTFQEAMLSTKRLYFSKRQLYWGCATGYCSEDSTARVTADAVSGDTGFSTNPLDEAIDQSSDPRLQFSVYQSLVQGYSWRALTYPSDAVNAFMGVMQQLSLRFGWSYVSALPEEMFELALLWAPITNDAVLRPRRFNVSPTGEPEEAGPAPCESPTWCWSAWTGHIYWDPVRLGSYAGKDVVIKSEVRSGFIFSSPGEGMRSLVTREGNVRLVNDQLKERGDPFTDKALKIVYEMNFSGPGRSVAALIFEAATQALGVDSLYRLDPPADGAVVDGLRPGLWIYDAEGRHCGSIRGLASALETMNDFFSYGFVLLSRCEQDEITDEVIEKWNVKQDVAGSSSAEYYGEIFDPSSFKWKRGCCLNIMLVRWFGDDGYAQRLAIGHMHANAWDEEAQKERCVILI